MRTYFLERGEESDLSLFFIFQRGPLSNESLKLAFKSCRRRCDLANPENAEEAGRLSQAAWKWLCEDLPDESKPPSHSGTNAQTPNPKIRLQRLRGSGVTTLD